MYNDTKFVPKTIRRHENTLGCRHSSGCFRHCKSRKFHEHYLRVLLKENLVEIADIVYSGTVLSRSYRPLISRDVYFNAEYKNIIGNSSTSAMIATFIEQEEDISELERIEELIRKRMKELEEAQ